MLSAQDLHVSYGAVSALRGISLEVKKGEIVAVIGPNGAGKSTLLWTIVGVLTPARGDVLFAGESIAGLKPETIVERGIALVPEGRRILATLTVRENLQLAESARRARANAAAPQLDAVLERFPSLAPRLADPAGQLSGGEAQQLAIARALLMRPDLLVLDEPSFGLAPLVAELVFLELEQLRSEGVTILLIEQAAARAAELADRTYVLQGGEVRAEGAGDRVLRQTDVLDAYLGTKVSDAPTHS